VRSLEQQEMEKAAKKRRHRDSFVGNVDEMSLGILPHVALTHPL